MLHGKFAGVAGFSDDTPEYHIYKYFLDDYLEKTHGSEKDSTNFICIDVDVLCGPDYPPDLCFYDNLFENHKEWSVLMDKIVEEWCGHRRDIFYRPPLKLKVEYGTPESLNHHKLDKLLRYRGIVDSFRPYYSKASLYHYECRCGNTLVSPIPPKYTKCPNDKFRMRVTKTDYISIMYFNLQIPLKNNPFAIIKVYYIIKENEYLRYLFEAQNIGEEVDILAIPRLIKTCIDGEEVVTYALELKGITLSRNRQITPERSQEVIETVTNLPAREALDKLCQSICPHIYRNDYVKLLALSVAVGLNKPDKDLGEFQNTALHILLVGDPSVGKTKTVKPFIKYFPKSIFMTGRGTTYVGLLGGAEKVQGGGFVMRIGQIVKSDKSFIVMDELDKIDENTLKGLYTGMSEGTHHLSNITGGATFNYCTSFIMCANPTEGKFDGFSKKHSQISMRADYLSRIHIVTVVERAYEVEGHYNEEMHDQYLRLRFGLKNQDVYFDEDFLMDYAVLVRQQENPRETNEVRELNIPYIKEKVSYLKKVSPEDLETTTNLEKKTVDERFPDTLRILQKRIAKALFSKTVEPVHFELAKEILEETFIKQLFRFGFTPASIEEMIDEAQKTKIPSSKLEKAEALIHIIAPGKTTEWGEIIRRAAVIGINEIEVDKLLNQLARDGEIFSPHNGVYSRLT